MRLKFKNIKRGYSEIDKDYNNNLERWNRSLDDIDFETWQGNYNVDGDVLRILTMNGNLFKAKWKDYVEQYAQQISDVLSKYVDEPVVEIGCGLGYLVFKLHHKNFKKLEGYDLSENSIELLKKYNEKKNYNIHFGTLDLIKPIPKRIIENKVVYTHGCLEQVKNYMPDVIKNIINGKPKMVINFEVDYNSEPFMVREYLNARDYQNNLVKELRKQEKQKNIEIISIKKLPLALTPLNRLSVIQWKIVPK